MAKKKKYNWIYLGYKDFLDGVPYENAPMTKEAIDKLERDHWPTEVEQYLDGLNSAAQDLKDGLITLEKDL